jgi:hypothetical protein
MSADRDVTRIVRSWLHEDTHEDADRILNLVLDEIDTTPQRRPGWLARRFPSLNTNIVRLGVAAAAIVLAVILGINYFSAPNVGNDPDASPSPSAAASAAASPKPLPTVLGTPLSPGTYFLTSFPVQLTVEVPTFEPPAEWVAGCSDGGVLEQSVCTKSTPTANVMAIGFPVVDNVVADPCGSGELLDPPIGPTVDDLVSAIANLAGFGTTTPLDIKVDGFDGKQFTVTAPDVPDCGLTWAAGERINGMGPGEANVVRILDVNGVRVVITGAYDPVKASEADRTTIEQFIAAINIEP